MEPPLTSRFKNVSTLHSAILVPVLVVMAQSAWALVRGWSFRYNTLLSRLDEPIVVAGMVGIAVASFFIIRPFANRTGIRLIAFLACVVGFTTLLEVLLPKFAE